MKSNGPARLTRRRALGGLAAASLMPGSAAAQDWDAIAAPGVITLMRHARAPGTGDPAEFRLDDCATQRNLDERGRRQAAQTGAALKARGIVYDRVWSSRWCRCLETARLMDMGEVEPRPMLDSFWSDRSRGPGQTETLRRQLSRLPYRNRPLLVTHQVNITALTGLIPRSGELIVVRMRPDGDIEPLTRALI